MEQQNDDKPVGRVLSRREALALLGSAGAAMFVGVGINNSGLRQLLDTATPAPTGSATTTPGCVVRPAETEGPYFVDEKLNRSDIRVDPSDNSVKDGVLLQVAFHVSQIGANTCAPLVGAQIDVWHCDAVGVYSDEHDPSFNTVGKKFLRGYQVIDQNGLAQFTTIYPGWYSGRTVHIHFKIRTDPGSSAGYEFTSQLFFDDSLTDQVHALQPYAAKGQRNTRNANDSIYQTGGDQLLLDLVKADNGYTTDFYIGVDTAHPQPTVSGPGAPGGPGGSPGGQPPNGTPPAPPGFSATAAPTAS